MSLKSTVLAALLGALPCPAFADITIHDAYLRTSGASAKSGAAFFVIQNDSDTEDRLVSATSPLSPRVELHTHLADGDGVMKMVEVEEGFVVPAKGTHALARGGDHVMFLGLDHPVVNGEVIELTLVFEKAGPVTVEVPAKLEEAPAMNHGKMDHGKMDHSAMGHN